MNLPPMGPFANAQLPTAVKSINTALESLGPTSDAPPPRSRLERALGGIGDAAGKFRSFSSAPTAVPANLIRDFVPDAERDRITNELQTEGWRRHRNTTGALDHSLAAKDAIAGVLEHYDRGVREQDAPQLLKLVDAARNDLNQAMTALFEA